MDKSFRSVRFWLIALALVALNALLWLPFVCGDDPDKEAPPEPPKEKRQPLEKAKRVTAEVWR